MKSFSFVNRFAKKPKGFTLIEIMIAMIIGLFLMGGVLQLFNGMRESSRLQEQAAYIQENGRLGIELLAKEIRNADYWGCTDASQVGSVINTDVSAGYDPDLHGAPGANGGGVNGTNNTGLNGSDTIVLRGLNSDNDIRVNKDQPQSATIQADSVGSLVRGDVVMITNCKGGDIFQVTNNPQTSGQQINHSTGGGVVSPGNVATYAIDGNTANNQSVCNNCLSQSYAGSGVVLGSMETTTFSIQTGASGIPSLFMTNTSNCTAGCELVEGVENMQVLFGEDTSNNQSVNSYLTANNVTNMENVIALKVSLLVRSNAQITESDQTLAYNGATTTYTDGLLRKVYSTTVTVRNRM
jgi:type IV pilus assembly protein PilW